MRTHCDGAMKVRGDASVRDQMRFWSRVDVRGPNECWPWTRSQAGSGRKLGRGYGSAWINGAAAKAHHAALILSGVEIGELHVLHTCDYPPCCNPSHLFLGTHQENMADRQRKGRCHTGPSPWCRGERHVGSKLTTGQVEEIRRRRASGEPGRALAAEYGVSEALVCCLCKGKRWAWLGEGVCG